MRAGVLAVLVVVSSGAVAAPEASERAFTVKVVGKGRPVVLIPGLSSSGEVWASTVEALAKKYECHVVSLAGFGGAKPVEGPLLPRVRDELIQYLASRKLEKAVLVGHSLGGSLALWIAAQAPDRVGGVVSLDGVAFMPALMNPAATVEGMKDQAAAMKARYEAMTPEQFAQANTMAMQSMVTKQEDLSKLLKMANSSDPRAVGRAVSELLSTDLRPELAKVRAPVLLLAAASWATTPELQERARVAYEAQVAAAPQHTVRLVPNARHFLMYDAQETVLRELEGFLGGAK